MAAAIPNEQPILKATLNENTWHTGEDRHRQLGADVLVWQDALWEFWVVEHEGQMTRKTIYRPDNRVWLEAPFFVTPSNAFRAT